MLRFDSLREKINNTYFLPTQSAFLKKISQYDVVSFDIFDTAVKRCTSNEKDIFNILIGRYNSANNTHILLEDYIWDRKKAKEKAMKIARSRGRDEVTLAEIYNCFPAEYDEIKHELMNDEIFVEISVCKQNTVIHEVYEWCIENKKKVIFISDMYLPQYCIKDILQKCGYDKYSKLFLSSDIGKRKYDGTLYKYIVDTEKINCSKMIHIGDSWKSDFFQAISNGIASMRIPKHPNNLKYFSRGNVPQKYKKEREELGKLINNSINIKESDFYKYGYESLGVLLFGFSKWLKKRIENNESKRAFFLARDGYLMKKSFDYLYPDFQVSTEYMYVSRKSLHFPLLWAFQELDKFLLINGDKRWHIEMLCNRLDIDLYEGLSYWKSLGLSENYSFKTSEINENTKIIEFYEYFKECSIKKSKKAFSNIVSYLKEIGFEGTVSIVDSGSIYCTTQRCLEEICKLAGIAVNIHGYYFWMAANTDSNVESYLFRDSKMFGGETMLIEFPLTSYEGTTISYQIGSEGKIIPVLDDYEYQDLDDLNNIIKNIQNGVIDFISDVRMWSSAFDISPEVAHSSVKAISQCPKLGEARMFGDVIFRSDNQDTYLAKPNSILFYLRHRREFRNDFIKTRWWIGFVKRLIKIPFPYYKLMRWLYESYKKTQ